MAMAKCKICGAKLNTATAHLVISHDRNGKEKRAYYCSSEEYETDRAAKEKVAADKDRVYRLICEIVGRNEIINGILWKEWAVWNKVATNETIGKYLEENKRYLIAVTTKIIDKEFNRIRYLSTIIKNKLGDYECQSNQDVKQKIQVEETMYMHTPEQMLSPMAMSAPVTRNNKRRSLADLEDEF